MQAISNRILESVWKTGLQRSLTRLTAVLLVLFGWSPSASAQARVQARVQVIRDQSIVWTTTVIPTILATLKAGTELEVVGEETGFYIVRVPAGEGRQAGVGRIAMSQVRVIAGTPPTQPVTAQPPPRVPQPPVSQPTVPEPAAPHPAAKQRRASVAGQHGDVTVGYTFMRDSDGTWPIGISGGGASPVHPGIDIVVEAQYAQGSFDLPIGKIDGDIWTALAAHAFR